MTWSGLVLAACLALAQEPRAPAPLANGLVRSVELGPLAGTWVQHFRLEREGGAGDPSALLGLARYVAGPDREGGVRVELELHYFAGDVRVMHVEQAGTARRRLVFREVRERAGRTLFLEGTPVQGFEGYELGGPAPLRRDPAGGELPLLLIETARLGFALPEHASVLDPLSAGFERLELARREMAGDPPLSIHEARRADGSLRWRVSARGTELREWRFQERGPVARAISPNEFEVLRERHELGVRQAREAALAAAARPGVVPAARE